MSQKTVCGIVLVLLWFRIIDKPIWTLSFHKSTYLLDLHPEAYSEPCQTSKLENFARIVNDF